MKVLARECRLDVWVDTGHGLEPRLRGLGETNLNILLDGAYVHNACPNRMDPPTSFGAVESFERVVVLKGVQTLRYGGGGNAGTVLYQRETPRFRPDEHWRASVGTSYATQSDAPGVTADVAWGNEAFYLRAIGEIQDVGNYEDGGGNEVRTGFEKEDLNFFLGYTPAAATSFELSFENNTTENALFPGAGMDAPFDENTLYRFQARHLLPGRLVSAIEADFYWGEIDHLMDNYSLRTLAAPRYARAPTSSDTRGGRVTVDVEASDSLRLTFGLDLQENQRQAVRFMGPSADRVTMEQSILWPGAEVSDSGLFGEGIYDLEGGQRLRFGARFDRFESSIDQVDRKPFGPNRSPRQLYNLYYGLASNGEAHDDWSQNDVGALLRYEHEFRPGLTLLTGLSRSVRQADATERYLASNASMPRGRWIGNPGLEPAKHHQLDIGLRSLSRGREINVVAFYDDAEDFILRDRARGQEGILRSDLATIYRNVEAELVGVEFDLRQRFGEHFSMRGNAAWVRGENRTDSRALAQIPPFEGQLRGDFDYGRWLSSAKVRFALRQDRVDDDARFGSGLDAGKRRVTRCSISTLRARCLPA